MCRGLMSHFDSSRSFDVPVSIVTFLRPRVSSRGVQMVRVATCCCGKTSIELRGDPVLNGICNCNDCKRRTGSAFGWSAYFEDSQVVRKTGSPRVYEVGISPPQQRYFCACCGSTLYWKSGSFPGMTGVAGGSFIDAPLPTPTASYRDGARYDWVNLPIEWQRHE